MPSPLRHLLYCLWCMFSQFGDISTSLTSQEQLNLGKKTHSNTFDSPNLRQHNLFKDNI